MRIVITALTLVLLISSCRKGEEDPFLSLRSREARLCGYWKLTSLIGNHQIYDDNHYWEYHSALYSPGTEKEYTFRIAFDGMAFDYYYDEFACWLDIREDHTMEAIYRTKGATFFNDNIKGSWSWSNSDGKKKEYVNLDAFGINASGFPYQLRKLSNKEITLVLSIDDDFVNDQGDISHIKGEYVYTFELVPD